MKTEWGVSRVEREREQQINGVRDGALDGDRNGVGWKWLLVKTDTRVFQINKLSIREDKHLGGS